MLLNWIQSQVLQALLNMGEITPNILSIFLQHLEKFIQDIPSAKPDLPDQNPLQLDFQTRFNRNILQILILCPDANFPQTVEILNQLASARHPSDLIHLQTLTALTAWGHPSKHQEFIRSESNFQLKLRAIGQFNWIHPATPGAVDIILECLNSSDPLIQNEALEVVVNQSEYVQDSRIYEAAQKLLQPR